jgi:hypothetical protein
MKGYGKAEVKRAKMANRYQCANVGCNIQTDAAPSCKPYLQNKQHVTRHRQQHGAPLSMERSASQSTTRGGTTRILSSSIMNAEMLKEIKARSEAEGGRRGGRGNNSEGSMDTDVGTLHVELEEFQVV